MRYCLHPISMLHTWTDPVLLPSWHAYMLTKKTRMTMGNPHWARVDGEVSEVTPSLIKGEIRKRRGRTNLWSPRFIPSQHHVNPAICLPGRHILGDEHYAIQRICCMQTWPTTWLCMGWGHNFITAITPSDLMGWNLIFLNTALEYLKYQHALF